jgi:hypothetical protein
MNRRVLLGILASAAALWAPAAAQAQLPLPVSCGSASITVPTTQTSTHFTLYKSMVPPDQNDYAPYLSTLEAAYAKQVTDFGWAPPPGSDPITVVVTGTAAGKAEPTGSGGDNDHTGFPETDATDACLHLPTSFSDGAQRDATIARELNRALLYGIGALTPATDTTLTESALALMEELTFPSADASIADLYPDFADSLGSYDGAKPRAQWLALRGMTERYTTGAEDVLQDMWERTSRNESHDLGALDAALTARGTPLAQAFHDYAIAARAMRTCPDDLPYCFTDAPLYLAAKGAPAPHETIAAVPGQVNGDIEDGYAIQWVELPAGPADVTVANTASGGVLRATAVCTAGSQPLRVAFPNQSIGGGQSSTIQSFPPAGCSDAAVVLTTGAGPADTLRGYTVSTAAPTATLSVAPTGTGTGLVASSPTGIYCGPTCSAPFAAGSVVTLGAAPTKDSTFTGWSGACSGTATLCEVTLDQAKSVTATFTKRTVTPTGSPTPTPTAPTGSGTFTQPESEALASDTIAPRVRLDRLKLTKNRRSLSLRVTCPPTEPHRCSGFVALTAKAAGKRLNFGQQAFLALKGGTRKTIKFPVTARSRSAMRRVGKLRVTAKARSRDDAFNYANVTRKLSVRTR